MRVATIVVVLVIHGVFFLLFAMQRSPLPRAGEEEALSTAFFVPLDKMITGPEGAPQTPTGARAAQSANSKRAARAPKSPGVSVTPPVEAPSNAITVPTVPDWRREIQIAANNEVEAERRKRETPSVLAPHDFSGVKPGSTDDSRPQFGWNYAATHRIEPIAGGGLLININDRCAIAWVVFPVPLCRIGKIPVRGNLFEHMHDAPAPGK